MFSRKEMTLDGSGLGVRLPQTLQLFGGPGGLGGTGAAGVGGEGSRPGASAKLAVGPAPLPHISVCVCCDLCPPAWLTKQGEEDTINRL